MATATIIMPTLDIDLASQTSRLARQTAGVETIIVMLWDYKMRGAVKTSNALFKAALHCETPYIAYLNDDTVPKQQDWLRLLIQALEQDARFGIACPSGECGSGVQRTGKPGDAYAVKVVKTPLAWFCAAIKRQVFEDVGLFDEGFIHYGDESDFIMRCHNKGWKQVWVKGVYIKHFRGQLDC